MSQGAGAFISIDVDEDSAEKLLGALDSTFNQTGLTIFMHQHVAPYINKRARSRFANEGDDAVGGAWHPLTQVSQDIRAWGISKGIWPSISPDHPINKRSGELERHITGGNGVVTSSLADTSLTFPGKTPTRGVERKLKGAQLGDRGPARPVLGLSQRDETDILMLLSMYMASRTRGRFGQ